MYDIFISYRTTYTDWVEALAHNLSAQGYSIFLDRWELEAGQYFASNIDAALRNSRFAILVATPDTSESGWVQQELELMNTLKNDGSDFFYIPIIMGEFPDLPFIDTVQAVDFGDSSPETYRRAFQQLLCGLQQTSPGPEPVFTGALKLPTVTEVVTHLPEQSEQTFLDQAFAKLQMGQPLIILAQADTNTQIYSRALRRRAEVLYGADHTFHMFPPNSSQADGAAYFGRLAKQCDLAGDIAQSYEWADAMMAKLDCGVDIFLLVTGFEHGPDAFRRELAGELRQLIESYSTLRVVMMGGERLAALKHESGDMSLLNIAEELPIPQLSNRDLYDLFDRQYPQLNLRPEQLHDVLEFTGHHPRLLQYCLQQGADSARTCDKLLRDSPLPMQLFTHFRSEDDRVPLCELLAQSELGRFDIWAQDERLRRLYWANLITGQGADFVWRCEFIRQIGREVLACG